MDWLGILAWGLCASIALVVVEAFGLWRGWTRMSTPVLLGTMLAADRDRAAFLGIGLHLAIGWAFALIHALLFEAAGFATWWFGICIGLGHEIFMAVAVLPALPAVHPRMASERHGPNPVRGIEPPGFLALNYGRRTVLVGLVSHACYGAILGLLYRVS